MIMSNGSGKNCDILIWLIQCILCHYHCDHGGGDRSDEEENEDCDILTIINVTMVYHNECNDNNTNKIKKYTQKRN